MGCVFRSGVWEDPPESSVAKDHKRRNRQSQQTRLRLRVRERRRVASRGKYRKMSTKHSLARWRRQPRRRWSVAWLCATVDVGADRWFGCPKILMKTPTVAADAAHSARSRYRHWSSAAYSWHRIRRRSVSGKHQAAASNGQAASAQNGRWRGRHQRA